MNNIRFFGLGWLERSSTHLFFSQSALSFSIGAERSLYYEIDTTEKKRYGWENGCKSRLKDCSQQSKKVLIFRQTAKVNIDDLMKKFLLFCQITNLRKWCDISIHGENSVRCNHSSSSSLTRNQLFFQV